MSLEAGETATKLLKGIVDDEVLASYKELLVRDGCPNSEAADLLGGPQMVATLTEAGMAYVEPAGLALEPRFVAIPPDLALQSSLAVLSRRLVTRQEQLLEGHRRMVGAHPFPGALEAVESRLVRILTDRAEISDVSRALLSTARHHWLTLENFVMERPLEELVAMPPLPAFEGEVRCRCIYQASCAETPIGARIIEIHMDGGEEARTVPRIGMKMKLADEAVALLPLMPTGVSGALLVRAPLIVGALRQYFELLWERAVPIGAEEAESPLSAVQRTILQLLAQDMTDERIARQIGLNANSVRRHIAAIRNELGAVNRLAAGAAAARRGWIK
ncbi:LuxR C-terminal-related transcriptional regulator [Actinomadura macra]|uniref:LuxR C-terminal-related transcriptional regulator n=1 Tax=Actinomadura macra TaxID=46164 RepID=UPI000831A1AC|nr:LuxR C-terminal-related transcriptional regulator [Actinomadura macra]